jgi:hypothetical protein
VVNERNPEIWSEVPKQIPVLVIHMLKKGKAIPVTGREDP